MSKKNPKFKHQISTSKNPAIHFKPYTQNFTWSFSKLDENGPWGWSHFKDSLLYIFQKKRDFELLTLSKLQENGSHSIPVTSICKEAQDRLLELKLEELDSLFSFHLRNKHRIWCIREENIMRVLWWDPDHKVYPTKKKHT